MAKLAIRVFDGVDEATITQYVGQPCTKRTIYTQCDYCGKLIEARNSVYRDHDTHFCNKTCYNGHRTNINNARVVLWLYSKYHGFPNLYAKGANLQRAIRIAKNNGLYCAKSRRVTLDGLRFIQEWYQWALDFYHRYIDKGVDNG